MFIRTERLFLRPGWIEDWQELLAGIDDAEVVRNLGRAPWPYTPDDAREFAALSQDGRTPRFVVTVPSAAGTRLIGACGLDRDDDGHFELGYWIARQQWGRGYATEAGRAVLGLARALGHARLTASHFTDNPASGQVLRKIGFQPTGRVRERFSRGRGVAAPSAEYAIDLDPANDGDMPGFRAA